MKSISRKPKTAHWRKGDFIGKRSTASHKIMLRQSPSGVRRCKRSVRPQKETRYLMSHQPKVMGRLRFMRRASVRRSMLTSFRCCRRLHSVLRWLACNYIRKSRRRSLYNSSVCGIGIPTVTSDHAWSAIKRNIPSNS